MAKVGGYKISDVYRGGGSSLNYPSEESPITAGSLGMTTDPRTANLLKDVSSKLSAGVKHMELEFVSPEIFDSMPQQHLTEVRRLSKLTGVGLSVHGPVIDSSGINQQGFSELNREASEKRMVQTIERSHELDPKGNILVTFHSSEGIPGTEWKTLGEERKAKRLLAINKESGKIAPLEEEKKFYPGGKIREVTHSPEENLQMLNSSEWDNSISQLIFGKERADGIMEQSYPLIRNVIERANLGEKINFEALPTPQKEALAHLNNAQTYLSDIYKQVNGLFSKAYKFGNSSQKQELAKISEEFKQKLSQGQDPLMGQSNAMQFLIDNLHRDELAPEMYVPMEKFVADQSSKTFGNTAFEAYKKFGDSAPIVSIENPPATHALSTGEDLKNLIEKSRDQFIERAKEEGMSSNQAKNQAEKLIGATWDVGHINMVRKQGFGEKEIVQETKKVAPFVKHVHLSDNFGFEHTELPMGMGNVPIKDIMAKLGEKGYEAKKIIEAGQWWQHFQTPPVQETLEALGSPVYSMKMTPYWNQTTALQQGYSSGYGMMLPSVHYQSFGAGFSQLPSELGGQMPGAEGSRMSGRGME